jgi:simple sugar transport system substrate-binding protein
MKHLLNILTVLMVATLVLTACGAPATVAPVPAVPATAASVPAAPATVAPVTVPPAATEGAAPAAATAAPQLVVYMQMGGTAGDASTLARTNGARAAAAAFNIKLVEQYSGWDPQVMIDQFKQAVAAKPDGIEIMGHPGGAAFAALVDDAESQGIIVTSGNNPGDDTFKAIAAKYQPKGFGYAGADLHEGGFLTGTAMITAGLKSGDEAVVYDIWHNAGRSVSSQGIYDALTGAGLKVDKLDATDAVDKDASLAIPILTAYIAAHPNLKAIGTQHGNITAVLPKVLQAAGKKPGDIIVGGIDLSPATKQGIQDGWISASFDQVLYLQGFLPIEQIFFTKMYQIPGMTINTGVGTFTPQNLASIAPLIDQGIR